MPTVERNNKIVMEMAKRRDVMEMFLMLTFVDGSENVSSKDNIVSIFGQNDT